jgi:hypothetical protein
MHERMKLVQGRLEISSGMSGTTVRARVPAMMKMGFRTLTDLIHYAIHEKIVSTPKSSGMPNSNKQRRGKAL